MFSPRSIKPALRKPASRAYAKPFDADLRGIADILRYRRAPGTKSFNQFVARVLAPVFGPADQDGNFILQIGKAPKTCWMAHSDTVERLDGKVALHIDANLVIGVSPSDKTSSCLGADCGAGIWLILEMIKAKKPGLYVICAEEETGCHGARDLAAYSPDLFKGITSVISLDRHDKDGAQVITEMVCGPTCSDTYANALCDLLPGYLPSKDGILTDSMEFIDLVPNVTNISVCYQGHHTPAETLDFAALKRLRDTLVTTRFDKLPTTPRPQKAKGYGRVLGDYSWMRDNSDMPDVRDPMRGENRICKMIEDRPYAVAAFITDMGLSADDLDDWLIDYDSFR